MEELPVANALNKPLVVNAMPYSSNLSNTNQSNSFGEIILPLKIDPKNLPRNFKYEIVPVDGSKIEKNNIYYDRNGNLIGKVTFVLKSSFSTKIFYIKPKKNRYDEVNFDKTKFMDEDSGRLSSNSEMSVNSNDKFWLVAKALDGGKIHKNNKKKTNKKKTNKKKTNKKKTNKKRNTKK